MDKNEQFLSEYSAFIETTKEVLREWAENWLYPEDDPNESNLTDAMSSDEFMAITDTLMFNLSECAYLVRKPPHVWQDTETGKTVYIEMDGMEQLYDAMEQKLHEYYRHAIATWALEHGLSVLEQYQRSRPARLIAWLNDNRPDPLNWDEMADIVNEFDEIIHDISQENHSPAYGFDLKNGQRVFYDYEADYLPWDIL